MGNSQGEGADDEYPYMGALKMLKQAHKPVCNIDMQKSGTYFPNAE